MRRGKDMSTRTENKYKNLKNYELESVFDLTRKEKDKLNQNIDGKAKHIIKLQEYYLKLKTCGFSQLEQEVLEYIKHNGYLLEKEALGKFYEFLAYGAHLNKKDANQYLQLSLENYPTTYTVKHLAYKALEDDDIFLAARLLLIGIEADIHFDEQLAYYNLVVDHYFEDDIQAYYLQMENFQEKYINVDNISIEFRFNKLIANYYIQKQIEKTANIELLKTKKAVNELLLKTISSMKNEDELRSEVLRVREALNKIENDQDIDIFNLITFKLLPVPKGEPLTSPFTHLHKTKGLDY